MPILYPQGGVITMPEEYRNIYKICRKSAGFTQEAAAERLGISVESLRAYETGQRVPPDEVVETMSDLYNALHLIVRHVRERNAMYSRVVPVSYTHLDVYKRQAPPGARSRLYPWRRSSRYRAAGGCLRALQWSRCRLHVA